MFKKHLTGLIAIVQQIEVVYQRIKGASAIILEFWSHHGLFSDVSTTRVEVTRL
jgi:hypothetical protein